MRIDKSNRKMKYILPIKKIKREKKFTINEDPVQHDPSIKIFYHVAVMGPRFQQILDEQIDVLNSSNINPCQYIWINIASGEDTSKLKRYIRSKLHYKYITFTTSAIDQYEYPTLIHLYDNVHPDDFVLYMHTKGVSSIRYHRIPDKRRRAMQKHCLYNWNQCLDKLRGGDDKSGYDWYDIDKLYRMYVRVHDRPNQEYFLNGPLYAGNFWWARGKYIKGCNRDYLTQWKVYPENRMWAETFIGSHRDYPPIHPHRMKKNIYRLITSK